MEGKPVSAREISPQKKFRVVDELIRDEKMAEFIVSLEYDKDEDFPNSYKEEYDDLLEWLKQESE